MDRVFFELFLYWKQQCNYLVAYEKYKNKISEVIN